MRRFYDGLAAFNRKLEKTFEKIRHFQKKNWFFRN